MDLYIYVGKSTGEFKLMRPVLCPSVLLRLKGQKDKFLHTHIRGVFCLWDDVYSI